MTKQIEPINIDGKLYYTVADFAHLIGRSENTIYRLVTKGNCFRRMLCTYEYMDKPLIPVGELTAYPFSGGGRYARKDVGHYNDQGVFAECFVCSSEGPGHCPNTKEE